jgi:uncharacterized membrane protein YfcA
MAPMTTPDAVLVVLVGLAAGVLSGLFGVGGGIVMTPGLSAVGLAPITALATPLPVILPTASVGAYTYARAGQVDLRAALWIALTGAVASGIGALLTEVVNERLLLLLTAGLLAWQAVAILRGRGRPAGSTGAPRPSPWVLAAVGLVAGLFSGLLGIGGGLVIVPALAGMLGFPLKRALGTSLVCVVVLVIPGTIVHALLGNLDWTAALLLALGAVPGARIGATVALGTREVTLRLLVGSFLAIVAVWYGALQVIELARG